MAVKKNPLEQARDFIKNLANTAGTNLSAWKQVATTPQLRQDYSNYVVKPALKEQYTPSNLIKTSFPQLSYAKGQIVQPIQEGVKSLRSTNPVTRTLGAGQIIGSLFSATPVGAAWNIGVGGVAGATRAVRTKAPLLASIKKGMTEPTSVTSEGLGVKSPFLAIAGDIVLTHKASKLAGTKGSVSKLASKVGKSGEVKTVTPLKPQTGKTLKVQGMPPETSALASLGGGGSSKIPSLGGSISQDPVEKLITALKGAKPIRGEQEKVYSAIRSKQAGALAGIGEKMKGEAGYYQKLGQLKGEMPKVSFETIKKQFTQTELDGLFNKVEQSNFTSFEKLAAQTGLKKLLGVEGGTIPNTSELSLLNEIFPPEFTQAVLDNRSQIQKLFTLGESALNVPRAVMATADLSAPLRQGIFLVGRPKQWVPAFKNMFKYALSEKAYQNLGDDIKARPNAKLYREAKLAITSDSPILGSREEQFMSNLVEKIPGFGRLARGSNRAYSGFLNKLRVDVFDDLVKTAQREGLEVDGKRLADIGKFVNSATGRGDIGQLGRIAPLLNATFFSPRLMASRINLLNPVFYMKLDPFVRKEALKSLLTFAGTAGTVLGLAKLAGAEVSADSRNADFGKIKVGNTRYDVLGGFQQYIRLGSQLLSGRIVSSTTGKVMTLGEGYKPLTRKDILLRFFENKTSPVASFVIGMLTGTNTMGDNFNLPAEVIGRFIPMMAQDVYDLTQEWGPAGALMAVPGIFGAGSLTYGRQVMVKGKNQLGKETVELKAPPTLDETIAKMIFGQQPLVSTPQSSADAYYRQMVKRPKEEATSEYQTIKKANPKLADKILQSSKDYKAGVTPQDEVLRSKGVESGDRAIAVAKELRKRKTKEEKSKLWDEYVKKKIITTEVAKQLKEMIKGGEL